MEDQHLVMCFFVEAQALYGVVKSKIMFLCQQRKRSTRLIFGVSDICSEDNIVGILTKSLQRGPFQMLGRKLGMISRKSL